MNAQDRTSEPSEAPVGVAVVWTFAASSWFSSDGPAWAGMTVVKSFPSVSVPVLVCPLCARSMVLTWWADTSDRNWV